MRLAWILLAALVAVGTADDADAASPSTIGEDLTTTVAGDVEEVTTIVTDAPGEKTDAPVVTDAPDNKTEDPDNTAPTVKTTTTTKAPAAATTTVKTTKTVGSTTTKEPAPDVENFSVKCDKGTGICTYSMQVPGLDIVTFNDLIQQTNETEGEVLDFENNDLVNLQDGVTKVFDDAKATADYVESQLATITKEINDLNTQAVTLKNAVTQLNTACVNANNNLQKILNKKGSCLYRQCVLRETTTARPITTTTTKKAPVEFCKREGNENLCKQNDGICNSQYDSYYCTCTGNMDGQDNDCLTSVCDKVTDVQLPGLVYSPGYNGSTYAGTADDDCTGAQWTIKTKTMDYLTLVETEAQWKDKTADFVQKLTSGASLQLSVAKYNLKINAKTKWSQMIQILGYGKQATFKYSGSVDDYFHFTLGETDVDPNDDSSEEI